MSFTGAVKKLKIVKKSIWDVDGGSASERIQERRERINKRIEAARKMQKLLKMQKMMGVFKESEEEEGKDFVKCASDEGQKNIYKIDNSGNEIVSNVTLSSDYIQVEHRNNRDQKTEDLKKMLDDEEEAMQKKFEEIVSTWPTQAEKLKGAPTQLFEEILAQKEMCNGLLRSKNNIIEMLESENRYVDEAFKGLVDEYHTNISVLSGRMEYHAQAHEDMLHSERKNLERSYDKQKSHQLRKGDSD